MIDFISKIKGSSSVIRSLYPSKFRPDTALITDKGFALPKGIRVIAEAKYSELPHFEITDGNKAGSVLFCRAGSKDILIYRGRLHFYDGVSMRSIAHKIYVLKFLGIKKIISIDEAAHLNPRFKCGEIALIYDHINLMGDNPLIGKNEDLLGVRFPDMSDAYDKKMFESISGLLRNEKFRINESVYLGITGPNIETDAEARFFREAGCDILGYSIVPENITAVHAGIRFAGIGLISRELVADKMMEDSRTDEELLRHRHQSLKKASFALSGVLEGIIKSV